jgi:hypothetical protein
VGIESKVVQPNPSSGGGGSGLTELNTLTADPQLFATGTSGNDFGISSSGDTHTFNLPNASATARGVVSTGAQTFAGQKTLAAAPILSALTASTVPYLDGSKVLTSSAVTPTELGYLSGVSSALQTQLDAKAPSANPTLTGNVTISAATASTFAYYDGSKILVSKTATEATALLDAFVGDSGAGGTKGLVPAPASGDAAAGKFLSADGSWDTPAGGSGVTGPASSTDNAIAVWDGAGGTAIKNSTVTIVSGRLSVPDGSAATPTLNVGGDAGAGFYSSSAQVLDYAIGGSQLFQWDNTPMFKMFGTGQVVATAQLQLRSSNGGSTVAMYPAGNNTATFYTTGELLFGHLAGGDDGNSYDIGSDLSGNATGNRFRHLYLKNSITLDATRKIRHGTVSTTNATQTTVASVTLSSNTTYWVRARVIGRNGTTDRAFYEVAALVYRDGGGATIEGSVATLMTAIESGGAAAWDVTITVSGNDARVSVTGAAATNINWACSLDLDAVA